MGVWASVSNKSGEQHALWADSQAHWEYLFPPHWALGGAFNSKMVRIALILISKEVMLPKPGNVWESCTFPAPPPRRPPPNCRVLWEMAIWPLRTGYGGVRYSQSTWLHKQSRRTSQHPPQHSSNQICTSKSLTQGPLESMSCFGSRISHWAHNLYFCCISAGFNHSTVVQNGALRVPEEQVERSMWKHLQKTAWSSSFYQHFAFPWVTFWRWFNFLCDACILLAFLLFSPPQWYSGACLLNSSNSCNIFNSYPLPASLSLLHGFPKVPDA